MSDFVIRGPHGEVPIYCAAPAGTGRFPGIVVIHDAGGMSNDLRHQADWLASEGFLAAAPNLYHGGKLLTCIRQIMREMRARRGRSFDEIDAVRTWLAREPGCTGTVGVIGFCMGGGFALLLAPGHGYAASSVNYGTASKDVYTEDYLRDSCPIVASYGARDWGNRGNAARLEQVLTAAGVPHDVKEYPDAGHAFMNDHVGAGDRIPVLFKVLATLTRSAYHEPSTRDARRRIVAFFKTYLCNEVAGIIV
jgi:carboxymethylenebutenolidase